MGKERECLFAIWDNFGKTGNEIPSWYYWYIFFSFLFYRILSPNGNGVSFQFPRRHPIFGRLCTSTPQGDLWGTQQRPQIFPKVRSSWQPLPFHGNVAQRSKNIDVIHCTIKYVIKVSTSTTWGLLVILPTGMFLGHYQIWKRQKKPGCGISARWTSNHSQEKTPVSTENPRPCQVSMFAGEAITVAVSQSKYRS